MVVCNKCKESFERKIEVEKVKGDIERTFFICPNCKEKYTAFLTNEKIRNKQEIIKNLWFKFSRAKGIGEQAIISKKINKLSEEINKDMEYLESKYN
ncbi:hypothetical protein ACV3RG_15925 [Clostridium perfringens]